MNLSKGDRVAVNGLPATVSALREIEDEPVIVLTFDSGERRSYILQNFKGEKI